MPVIDTQTHYVSPRALEALGEAARQGKSWPRGLLSSTRASDPICNLDVRLREMDSHGVDVSVLSFAPIEALPASPPFSELCRIANDDLIAACALHPDRFVALAFLPLSDVDAALAELTRIGSATAVRGISLVAQSAIYLPEKIGLEDLLRDAAEAGLPAVIHPSAGSNDLGAPFTGFGLESGFQAMVSHALVAARIVLSGMMDRIPDLTLILTHLGGVLPFLCERLDSRAKGQARFDIAHYLSQRMYFDLCGYFAPPLLRFAVDTLGTQRLLLGSDWPSRPIGSALAAIESIAADEAAREEILGGNASRWFLPAREGPVPGGRHLQ